MILKDKKISVISLGCDKNRVDTERMLASIKDFATLTDDPTDAEIIVINTCAFIEPARKESIDTVLEFNSFREYGKLEKLVVTGCLTQRFADEIFKELKEADVLLGFLDYDLLKEALELSYATGERVNYVGRKSTVSIDRRVLTTPLHYAYLKIAEGCDNRCTYCLIPSIRGRYVSEPMDKLVKEAESLGDLSELILVAQDTTRYGTDLYGKPMLPELIRKLSAIDSVSRIRLLYCYPDMITDELILEIKNNPKVIKYLDIPLQHSDDTILKLMNRKGRREDYIALIEKLRREIPQIAIRSTFIAGFPGEDDKAFENLKSFLEEVGFENAGFFAYSKEEGTPAFRLPGQVKESVKKKRVKELYALQKEISARKLARYKGVTCNVMFDEIDYDKGVFVGRAYFSAPDTDGKVYFTSDVPIKQGNVYKVKIQKTDAYDMYGRLQDEFTE